jgi:hypothetical protein
VEGDAVAGDGLGVNDGVQGNIYDIVQRKDLPPRVERNRKQTSKRYE